MINEEKLKEYLKDLAYLIGNLGRASSEEMNPVYKKIDDIFEETK